MVIGYDNWTMYQMELQAEIIGGIPITHIIHLDTPPRCMAVLMIIIQVSYDRIHVIADMESTVEMKRTHIYVSLCL